MKNVPTDKYEHFNHHHELTDNDEIVDFGDGEFIANKAAVPLLKALNELGLKTRTHHVDENGGFVSIILSDNIRFDTGRIIERDSSRTKFNGKRELLINWENKS